ncbi:MAG TPA: histidine--tRNA ligase [Acidimicrobiales bacterium]|nr:histidine--tRNA ligase [Acidimicrobiales bacterium]
MPDFQAPPGTFDVLPPQSARYERLVAAFADHVGRAGYGLVVSPMFEDIGVFQRVGESTDVVRKEMYDFDDKGGRRIALRPEGTASVVRAYVQHRPTPPFKAWYAGPNFRYERPQAGRYRQHHQVGVEVLGTEDPDLDVEVVALLSGFYARLGLQQVTLKLNSLGDAICRPAYRDALAAHFRTQSLCDEHKDRIDDNPLRILDCKRDPCRAASADAPLQVDHLCDPCKAHYDRVQRGLSALAIAYTPDPRLVRGLDYYTRTTFEFAATALDSAQDAVGGGGRYDGLAESLGGPPTPGIGFGAGIERILLACDAEGVFPTPATTLDVFVVDTTGGDAARDATSALRQHGIRADRAFDNRSWKSQMKAATRSGAPLTLNIEPDGWTLRTSDGEREPVTAETVVDHVRKRL